MSQEHLFLDNFPTRIGIVTFTVILFVSLATLSIIDFVHNQYFVSPSVVITQQSSLAVVRGNNIHWVKIINQKHLKDDQHFISIPAHATNVKVLKITKVQARNTLQNKPSQTSEITLKDRVNLASKIALLAVAKRDSSPYDIFSYITSLSSKFIGDLQEGISQAVILSQIVDLNSATPEEMSVPTDMLLQSLPETFLDEQQLAIDIQEFNRQEQEAELVKVEYDTPAPQIQEEITDTGKTVTVFVSSTSEDPEVPVTNVLVFTMIPEIYKVGQESKIKVIWKNKNGEVMPFTAHDTNDNGKLDYIEWTVPHLSEQIFEIIFYL